MMWEGLVTGQTQNGFGFTFSTLPVNVCAQDLHSGLLSCGGAWNEHYQCSIPSVTAVNKWLQEWVSSLTVWLGLNVPALPSGSCTQFFVEFGLDKPRVRVVLHEAVNLLLSWLEGGGSRLLEALGDRVFSFEIQVYLWRGKKCHGPSAKCDRTVYLASGSRYLFRGFIFDELLVNLFGLRHALFLRLEVAEILAGRPKLDVLFTELGLQESIKHSFAICTGKKSREQSIKDVTGTLNTGTHLLAVSVIILRPINHLHRYRLTFETFYVTGHRRRSEWDLHLWLSSLSSDCAHWFTSSALGLRGREQRSFSR